jgi:hypothetical protein
VPSCPRRRRGQHGHRDLHRDLQSDLQTFLVICMTHWKEAKDCDRYIPSPLLFSNVRAFFRRSLRSRVERRIRSPTLPRRPRHPRCARRHVAQRRTPHVARRQVAHVTAPTPRHPRQGAHVTAPTRTLAMSRRPRPCRVAHTAHVDLAWSLGHI